MVLAAAFMASSAFATAAASARPVGVRSPRMTFDAPAWPGNPAHVVHFVPAVTARAALTASHSLGETTATKLPLTTTSAVGNFWRSIGPADTSVEPRVAGRTVRACSMPGSRRSATHCVLAVTLSAICGEGNDVPMTVYFDTDF